AAFDRIEEAQSKIARYERVHRLLELGHAFQSELFDIAHTLVRAAEEYPKPDGERLREFAEAGKASLEMGLFSDKPIHDDLEILRLADSLTYLAEQLGAQNPTVLKVLAGKSPRARAAELITGSRLRSVDERRRLHQAGATAVAASADPLIQLARTIDPEAREVRRLMEAESEVKKQAHAAIAAARFALEGKGRYPDATFTLRLSYGVVKGYTSAGKPVPAVTRLGGIFERSAEMEGRPPFDLPDRWLKKRKAIRADVPFNFVSTHDIIGGNSGSPVVNRDGEFVGIIFDGNIESLVLDLAYDDERARAVSVDAAGILAALTRVYRADALVAEIAAAATAPIAADAG
ncbi:MAG: S46 family peptidase, partial [Verrucomicrobiota bacterium]